MPTIPLREGIGYHSVADSINSRFRTCTLRCGAECEPLTRQDLEPAIPYQSCRPAVEAAEPERLQALVVLETLRPKEAVVPQNVVSREI